MTDARTRIMTNIRRGLGRETARTLQQAEAQRRTLQGESATPRPGWSGDRVARLVERFEAEAGTWQRVSGLQTTAEAIRDHLSAHSLGDRLLAAPHPLLDGLNWPDELTVTRDSAGAADCNVAVSVAEAGVAETGTLVFWSGPTSPTSLTLLPDVHIAILLEDTVVDYMEDIWRDLQQRQGFPPRSLNFITGPSRTADVEQTIQLGAHGPRAVHMILVDQA